MAARDMAVEMSEDTGDREIDVLGLGCSKETFTEHEEVVKLIDELLRSNQVPSTTSNTKDFRIVEINWQRFSFILDQYQEQPHLIDPHLEKILNKVVSVIRNEDISTEVKHIAFRYL